jgi:hypothetical protein
MNAFVAFLSPFALLLPAVVGELPAARGDLSVHEAAERVDASRGFNSLPSEPFEVLKQARQPRELGQVRIEQRVIIRISPGTSPAREQMMADLRARTVDRRTTRKRSSGLHRGSNIVGMEPARSRTAAAVHARPAHPQRRARARLQRARLLLGLLHRAQRGRAALRQARPAAVALGRKLQGRTAQPLVAVRD